MSQKKTIQFDKFINDICKREEASRKKIEEHLAGQEELPQRRYNKLYREKWQNSIRYNRREK
jgi:cytidylate kinase